ncbi:hypothetical protein C0993_012346 [Termitomyces sp. T159_Od127]|nr:hypothetical protein C0993_012346 [Termitomyces sp. T159_Od127]
MALPPTTGYGTMTDVQLRQTISQLSSYAAPSRTTLAGYMHTWSATPPPKTARPRPRTARPSLYPPPVPAPAPAPALPLPAPAAPPNPPRPPLGTTAQALTSTYASRLRTGATLLMQPILAPAAAAAPLGTRSTARRGAVVNYADPASGDELPDAGALDSDDSDFVASGGARLSVRARGPRGASATPGPPQKAELDQSYLGLVPPARFIRPRHILPTQHVYPSQDVMDKHARNRTSLIPIRVEFETDTHRIRDCFVWNLNESLIKPETFARTFCNDLDLPLAPWADTVANQIRAQIEEHEGVASMDLGVDGAPDAPPDDAPECRVILSIDVQVANLHISDHIEWDLLSPLTPEAFARTLCRDLGLGGEAVPLVAHAVHEELIKHKKDAIEWGVIDHAGNTPKDKTGLGLGWGRAGKEGRGPKSLRGVWRDWVESGEFATSFEVLSAEEVERREIERERANASGGRRQPSAQTSHPAAPSTAQAPLHPTDSSAPAQSPYPTWAAAHATRPASQ